MHAHRQRQRQVVGVLDVRKGGKLVGTHGGRLDEVHDGVAVAGDALDQV